MFMNFDHTRFLILSAGVMFGSAVAFTQPQVHNANMRLEPAGPSLQAKLDELSRSAEPLWAGYEIAAIRASGRHHGGGCGIQYLEDGRYAGAESTASPAPPTVSYIFLRLANRAISKVEVADQGCQIDAGGMPVVWLTGVKQEDSIAALRGIAERENSDSALMAIGLHESPTATRVLAELASARQNPRFREKASFWLANERAAEGWPALQQLARDSDARFREKITFQLTLVADSRAVDELIRMAESDSDAQVRSQAMFWLAQKAGEKAAGFLASAAQNDPEVEVKKKAVFGLSQLPKDEGIPRLIHVAETNSDREVRKQAIFWLGQSADPRALKYLEQVLSR
jgi:HEAT repeat protein